MNLGLSEHIVMEAHKCFHLYGFRKTSVDEIASGMGISKKTIYKYFSSKDDLIRSVIELVMEPLIVEMDSIIEKKIPVPDAFKALFKVIQKLSSGISRPMLDDIRMLPESWELIERKRRKVLEKLSIILTRGKAEGIVREDLDIDLFIKILINTVDTFASPNTLLEMDMTSADFVGRVFPLFMNGILVMDGGT